MKINKGTTVKINSNRLKQFSGCEGEIVEVQPIYQNTSDRVDQEVYTEFKGWEIYHVAIGAITVYCHISEIYPTEVTINASSV